MRKILTATGTAVVTAVLLALSSGAAQAAVTAQTYYDL